MPQPLYSTRECERRTYTPPDFGPGDIVESCWEGSDHHLELRRSPVTVARVERDTHGRYIIQSDRGISLFAGYYRKPAGAARTKTNHRIGVPKNKLP